MAIKFKKKLLLLPVAVPIFMFIIVLGFVVWFRDNSKAVSDNSSKQRFLISKGMSASLVGQKLYESGLIRSPLAFKLYVQLFDRAGNINAGEFLLSQSMSMTEIVNTLGKGAEELWITIPEGLRHEEIAEKFISGLELEGDQVASFRKEFLSLTSDKEGYLFPDTYLFSREVKPDAVVTKMVQTLNLKLDEKMKNDINSSGKKIEDILIMASLIERETKNSDERPIVSGILWKRLENNWPLQVDAALQYALGSTKCKTQNANCDWWPEIFKTDIEISSAYNTYKESGLPPTPICNPGLSSIMAAIYPQNSDYWFYIHDAKGKIHYAETIEEHNLNISRYLNK